jgi:hypothetical protein
MKNSLISFVIVAAVLLLFSGCAAKKEMTAHGDVNPGNVTIAAGDFFEACDMDKKWTPGNRVNIKFSSSAPVMFNVHYHQEHVKMYAIAETMTDSFDGGFIVEGDGIHCGMWKNDNPEAVTMTYDISVGKQ